MKDGVLTLDFGRDERRLKVAFFEGEQTTLRSYEIHEPDWRQIEESCRDILSALNRSNRSAKPSPDVLNGLKKSGQLLFDLFLPPKAKEKLADTTAKILTLRFRRHPGTPTLGIILRRPRVSLPPLRDRQDRQHPPDTNGTLYPHAGSSLQGLDPRGSTG